MKRILLAIVTACLAAPLFGAASALAANPVGTWYTAGNRAQVRIRQCGGASLCGSIVRLKTPNDPKTGRPWNDIHNPDPAKRTRPLVGVRIILSLNRSGAPNKWRGRLYNADDGRTYGGYLTMTSADTLELKGCVLAGIICRSETWTRVRSN